MPRRRAEGGLRVVRPAFGVYRHSPVLSHLVLRASMISLPAPVRRRNGAGAWRTGTRSRRYWRCVAATASSACGPHLGQLLAAAGPARPRAGAPGAPLRGSARSTSAPGCGAAAPGPARRSAGSRRSSATGRAGPCARRCAGSAGASPSARPPPRSRRRPGCLRGRPITVRRHRPHPSTAIRGAGSVTSANDSTAARCSSVSSVGTTTSTLTSRSPGLAPLRPDPPGTPRPRTRSTLPDCVPGGTFSVTLPSSVGTVMVVPRRRLGVGDRHRDGQVAAAAPEDRVRAPRGRRRRGRRRAPCPARARPRPLTRMRWPSSTPAGMRTLTERTFCSVPVPWQTGHGVSNERPAAHAVGADGAQREQTLVVVEAPGPAAARAGVRRGARARPRGRGSSSSAPPGAR